MDCDGLFHVLTAYLIRPSLALLAIAIAAGPARAQQPPVLPTITQTVIVTATASSVPEKADARATTVLTREDLEAFGLDSLADALRLAAGLDVRARGPRDVQTDFALRGATFGQSLVLVDGLRLNDSQSGHHNGEIPLALLSADRIEIVNGPASAAHGADALGGTIHVLSRQDTHGAGTIAAGQFGYVSGQASFSGVGLPAGWLVSGWGARSSGFAFDRDFAQGGASLRAAVARGLTLDVRHQRRAFGANGFYGASPSKEWTDQTLASAAFRAVLGPWLTEVRGLYRNHGDHFRWDINRPGFAENRHRTQASDLAVSAQRDLGGGRRVTLGTGGGGDWIDSTNLGDRRYSRVHGFAELHVPVGERTHLQAGLRFDRYSTFGRSWNPTLSASSWIGDRVRLRGSVGRAFRVPTFTELYYRDPAHQASAALAPEAGWSLDGGADWTLAGLALSVSPFVRWDENVIDWVKAEPADLWRTTNVRDVTTRGVEASIQRRFRSALVRLSLSGLDVDAPALSLLSKYVLEYASRSAVLSVAVPLGGGLRGAFTIDHRRRVDGQSYALAGIRLSKRVRRADVFLDASNLFDTEYVEIKGVEMPGRWVSAGVAIR
jgi:iron complex outermembrane receptor protein